MPIAGRSGNVACSALDECVAHYHGERNHQGLGNELIAPAAAAGTQVRCRDRLGGLLRYYYRAA